MAGTERDADYEREGRWRGYQKTPTQHADPVRINYSVVCDDCGLVGAGLNEEQAKALKKRHPVSRLHNDGDDAWRSVDDDYPYGTQPELNDGSSDAETMEP